MRALLVRSLESSTRHLKVASAGDVNACVVVMEWQTVSMIHARPRMVGRRGTI